LATHWAIVRSGHSRSLGGIAGAAFLAVFALLIGSGCGDPPPAVPTPNPGVLFGPASMRIHPIFTQIKDWTGAGVPTGVEVLLEFDDQFGDPCKASGRVIFELYEFNKFDPQRKGQRLVNPYVGDLTTLQAQRDRWNRTSRTYTFQLFYYNIPTDKNYILTAVFQGDTGGRFFDQIVLEAQPPPTTRPTTERAAASPLFTPGTPILTPSSSQKPSQTPGARTPQP
jgi:hypothetical protein